jgi:hypothetical protein
MQWEALKDTPEGAYIELKGFLFQSPDHSWILSSEPGLKSCCMGALHKKDSQVSLDKDFSDLSSYKPLQMGGNLYCVEGKYTLFNSQAVSNDSYPLWTSALLCCLGVIVIRALWRKL